MLPPSASPCRMHWSAGSTPGRRLGAGRLAGSARGAARWRAAAPRSSSRRATGRPRLSTPTPLGVWGALSRGERWGRVYLGHRRSGFLFRFLSVIRANLPFLRGSGQALVWGVGPSLGETASAVSTTYLASLHAHCPGRGTSAPLYTRRTPGAVARRAVVDGY